MLTAASSWRECTGCFCLASPFNLAFTWATEITLHLNTCPVKCTRNVASSESRRSSISAYPFRRIAARSLRIDALPAETGTLILEDSAAASQDRGTKHGTIRGQTGLTQLFWRQRLTPEPEGAVLLRLYRHEWNSCPSRALLLPSFEDAAHSSARLKPGPDTNSSSFYFLLSPRASVSSQNRHPICVMTISSFRNTWRIG
jgi:hypothetical protein